MYQIIILPHFRKSLKRYKKHRHLLDDVFYILKNFDKNRNIHIGKNVYKIRFSPKDLPKGKSKSFRLIVMLIEIEKFLVPITLYYKGNTVNITKKEISKHIKIILSELNL